MDKIKNYQQIIQSILKRHAQLTPSHGKIQPMPICDAHQNQFLLMDVGWDVTGRVYSVVFHLRIQNGKIWVEWDGTSPGIVQELLDAGVPKEDIVLAFYRPERRKLTEFAVA